MLKRFPKKIDKLFWLIISLLPVLIYMFLCFQSSNIIDFATYIESWSFPFISDMFNDIFTGDIVFPAVLVNFISYCVSVEIIHVFFDFIVFIPRFCHKFLGGFYAD